MEGSIAELHPVESFRDQLSYGDLLEWSGDLNFIYIKGINGQLLDKAGKGHSTCVVFRICIHVDEEIRSVFDITFNKIIEMCKLMEEDKLNIIL